MSIARKVKVSVNLDAGVLDVVDRLAKNRGTTRSVIMEGWLRQIPRSVGAAGLAGRKAPQPHALTARERAEDAAWTAVLARAARAR